MTDILAIQSRNPGIWTSIIPGFGIEKMGRDPGIGNPNSLYRQYTDYL